MTESKENRRQERYGKTDAIKEAKIIAMLSDVAWIRENISFFNKYH